MKEIYENFEQIRERFDILKSNYPPYEFLSKGFLKLRDRNMLLDDINDLNAICEILGDSNEILKDSKLESDYLRANQLFFSMVRYSSLDRGKVSNIVIYSNPQRFFKAIENFS